MLVSRNILKNMENIQHRRGLQLIGWVATLLELGIAHMDGLVSQTPRHFLIMSSLRFNGHSTILTTRNGGHILSGGRGVLGVSMACCCGWTDERSAIPLQLVRDADELPRRYC